MLLNRLEDGLVEGGDAWLSSAVRFYSIPLTSFVTRTKSDGPEGLRCVRLSLQPEWPLNLV